jgi:uncharacterized membrane protein
MPSAANSPVAARDGIEGSVPAGDRAPDVFQQVDNPRLSKETRAELRRLREAELVALARARASAAGAAMLRANGLDPAGLEKKAQDAWDLGLEIQDQFAGALADFERRIGGIERIVGMRTCPRCGGATFVRTRCAPCGADFLRK